MLSLAPSNAKSTCRPIGRKNAKKGAMENDREDRVEKHIEPIAFSMKGQYRELGTYNRIMALSMPGVDTRSRRALALIRKRICKEIEHEESIAPNIDGGRQIAE